MKISVILLAGGRGTRMKAPTPKQFLLLKGKPIALHSFEIFASHPEIFEIIVVCEEKNRHLFPNAKYAVPGDRRQDSLYNGMQQLSECDLVCVHDSARPLLQISDLNNVLSAAKEHGAAILASPVNNTMKRSDSHGFITGAVDRSMLWQIYTPQVAQTSLLLQGLHIAIEQKITVTDESSLLELIGYPVKLVQGSPSNLKITVPEDLAMAEALLNNASL